MTIKKKQVLCIFLAIVAVITMMLGQESSRKSNLRELLNTERLESSIYTPISYQMYSESLAAAEAVEQNFFASSDEIDSACSKAVNQKSERTYRKTG